MKKFKKLVLCRETLGALESSVLGKAGGGAPPATRFGCPLPTGPTCDCTLSCPELCQFSGQLTCLCL